MRHSLLLGVPVLISALTLIGAAGYHHSEDLDSDGDGMSDAYELFFGLNPTNPADASPDYDGDRLSNLQESAQLTDPFAKDTDCDGFSDSGDVNPISRSFIQWGSPRFTSGDQYDYAHPDWFLAAYKNGGEWIVASNEWVSDQSQIGNRQSQISSQSSWHVASTESPGVGSLSIDLDRAVLTNNLRYAVHYSSGRAGQLVAPSLYVDLLDTNGIVVAENLCGNLMAGSNEESSVILDIPTAEIAEAAVIQLRRGEGEVIVYEGLVYIDEDGDGLDSDQEIQIGTSDCLIDTDGDGTNDYEKCFGNGSSTNRPGGGDDGDKDKGKDKDKNENKKSGAIYVDQAVGNDQHTGRARSVVGQDGPKKTVRGGLSIASTNDVIIIKSGDYHENLNISGKDVKVVIEGNVRL